MSDQRAANGAGDGRRKKGEDKQPKYPVQFKPCPESAENWLGRAWVIFAVESNFRSLHLTGLFSEAGQFYSAAETDRAHG